MARSSLRRRSINQSSTRKTILRPSILLDGRWPMAKLQQTDVKSTDTGPAIPSNAVHHNQSPKIMFKSIATMPNFSEEIASTCATTSAIFYRSSVGSSGNGTVIVAAAASVTMCRILYYSVNASSNQSQLSPEDFSFARSKCISFQRPIEALALTLMDSTENNNDRVPVLMAVTRDGRMHKSGSLVALTDDDISLFECKINEREANDDAVEQNDDPLFAGMNLLSVNVHPENDSEQCAKEVMMIVAGTCTLSSPMIVTVPSQISNATITSVIQATEIEGLEHINSSITAVKLFHEGSVDSNSWKGLQYLWQNSPSYIPVQSTKPNWDDLNLSVAMIGFSDGSMYAAFISNSTRDGHTIMQVSHAVQMCEMRPSQSIVSFCLVPDTASQSCFVGSKLFCIGSLGHVMTLVEPLSEQSPRFQTIVPRLANESEADPRASIGLIANAEPFPIQIRSYASEEISSKRSSWPMIATANNGSTHLVLVQKEAGDDRRRHTFLGHYSVLPLRKDIARVVGCSIPPPAKDEQKNDNILPTTVFAGVNFRRGMSLFIAPTRMVLSSVYNPRLSCLEMMATKGAQSVPDTNSEHSPHDEEASSINAMMRKLAALDAAKNDIVTTQGTFGRTADSVRYAADLVSPLWSDAARREGKRDGVDSSVIIHHDPHDANSIQITMESTTCNQRAVKEINASILQ